MEDVKQQKNNIVRVVVNDDELFNDFKKYCKDVKGSNMSTIVRMYITETVRKARENGEV